MKLSLLFSSEKRRRRTTLKRFPTVSGAYIYTPTAIRGWVNSRGADRYSKEWERANIRIIVRRNSRLVGEVQAGPIVKEGPLVDGRRNFVLLDHRIKPHEILCEQVSLHIVLEGIERGDVKLYPSEQIRLIPEVFPKELSKNRPGEE